MISKLYGYADTDDTYTPYHFKNCSKNGCVTKHYLGYTIELTENTGYCGSCSTGARFADDSPYPVTIRGDRYSNYPNNCCVSLAFPWPETVTESNVYVDENGNTVVEWYFDIQDSPTQNCYELRNSVNDKIELSSIITSSHSKKTLENLADKICKKPAHFDCAASSITWMERFPTTALTDPLQSKLLPRKNIDNFFIASVDLPDSDMPLDLSDHIYPYNYQVNCDYAITLQKETYTSELETDLVIPDFIYATYSIPAQSLGSPPHPCIENPIFGNAGQFIYYNDGICKRPKFPCEKQVNPNIIWDFKTGEFKEPIGCCKGLPQENYCCNKDFLKKIETQEIYECFNITTENRKFIGQRKNENESEIDIHCNKNEITGQYYNFSTTIPVCVAQPTYMTVGEYDVVLQGACDADPIPSGSSEYCPPFMFDPDDFCTRLTLTYQKRIELMPKEAVTLEFYYCEITYIECGS